MCSNFVSNRESNTNKPFRVGGLIRGSVMWHVLRRKWPLSPPQSTSLLRTLGKCFPQCYTRCRGVGSLLQADSENTRNRLPLIGRAGYVVGHSSRCRVRYGDLVRGFCRNVACGNVRCRAGVGWRESQTMTTGGHARQDHVVAGARGGCQRSYDRDVESVPTKGVVPRI